MLHAVYQTKSQTPSSLLSFSASEIEMLLEIARHWMKLKACHEIDNDLILGGFFYKTWNPRSTILKIEKQCEKRGKIKRGGWSLMPLRLADDFDPLALGDDPLSKIELVLVGDMVAAAASGGLKRFAMDGAVLQEVQGLKVSAYWSGVKALKPLSEKLALAAYEIEQEREMRFNEANYA